MRPIEPIEPCEKCGRMGPLWHDYTDWPHMGEPLIDTKEARRARLVATVRALPLGHGVIIEDLDYFGLAEFPNASEAFKGEDIACQYILIDQGWGLLDSAKLRDFHNERRRKKAAVAA